MCCRNSRTASANSADRRTFWCRNFYCVARPCSLVYNARLILPARNWGWQARHKSKGSDALASTLGAFSQIGASP